MAKARLLEVIDACLSIGLLFEKDGYYFSNRLLRYKEFRKSMSEYGKIGADARWGGYGGANRGANGRANAHSNANNRIGNNRIEKEVIFGDFFAEDGLEIIFKDGSRRKLTHSEKQRLKHNDIKPEEIKK